MIIQFDSKLLDTKPTCLSTNATARRFGLSGLSAYRVSFMISKYREERVMFAKFDTEETTG